MECSLQKCPDCGGHLTAITPPGVCPACGFAFDEHARVWRSSRTWQHHSLVYGLTGLVSGLLVTVSYRLKFGEVPNPLLPIAAAVAVAAVGLLIDRILAGRLSGRFVAITSAGIVLGTRGRRRLIVWDDVGRLRTRHQVPKLESHPDGLTIPLEDLFDSADEVEDFRRALEQARRRHAEEQDGV